MRRPSAARRRRRTARPPPSRDRPARRRPKLIPSLGMRHHLDLAAEHDVERAVRAAAPDQRLARGDAAERGRGEEPPPVLIPPVRQGQPVAWRRALPRPHGARQSPLPVPVPALVRPWSPPAIVDRCPEAYPNRRIAPIVGPDAAGTGAAGADRWATSSCSGRASFSASSSAVRADCPTTPPPRSTASSSTSRFPR